MENESLIDKLNALTVTNAKLTEELERQRVTERRLQQNQQFLNSILSNASIVVWSIDLNGIFTYSQFEGDRGIEKGERIGKSAFDIYKGTEMEFFLRKVLKGEIKNDILKVGDIYYDTRVSAIYNETSEKTGYIVISMDVTECTKIEKAFRESEIKYKTLVENSLDGIIIVRNNKTLFVNNTFCKMVGNECETILNAPSMELIHPEDRQRMVQISEMRNKGIESSINETVRILGKNGQFIDCEAFFTVIDYEGQKASIISVHDVTEKNSIQKALLESEKKYRDVTELLPQTIYELDLKGNITYMNQTGLNNFGITKADYGISAFRFIHHSDHEKMRLNMQKSIRENYLTPGNNYTAVRKNGGTFPVMIFASPIIDNNKVTGTRGIILDMTEHEAMQNALRESEEKYKTLIEKALDGIIITQLGKFKFVNRAFCEMMNYSAEELIDKPYLDFVEADHHEMLKNFQKRRMDGEEFQVMYRSKLKRKDGKALQVELNIRTSELDGKPSAFIITRNITDRLKTEEELRIAKEKLEMLNQNLEIRIQESSLKLTEANTQLIRLQKENLQSQFEVLRQQVNPHFLFNSLNVLTSLIKLEPDLAEKFTEHLSKVYRYVLENKDNDLVNLRTELDFLDAYIFLLNIRFMGKIIVNVNIEEEKKDLLILPLAMQLLIENAIKHNSMSKKNPLKIDISIVENNILKIENNLQERESHMASTGVGLKNIEHRYSLLEMPAPEFVKAETKFIARIPLKG